MRKITLEDQVLEVLLADPEARKDDRVLIFDVLKNANIINDNTTVRELFLQKKKMPSMHSITRTRRKLQEKNPELRDQEVSQKRYAETEKYIAYSRDQIESL